MSDLWWLDWRMWSTAQNTPAPEPLLTREEAANDPEVVRVVRERDPLRRKIDDWAQAYPTSVFPEPDHKSTGHDPTLCSASMGRHILNTLQGYYETEVTDDE